ncbi:hypothetical protein JKP88DRAFT_284378 [Tribonema minus]|uniref:Uncharacterized protein n=1 Tax=Tribonema minus TaxID=303371 RepID=A0A835ZK92_9STRA|nr:hypothetical protein JKP88DRAFT_284378 [Tribonema minus]
MATGLYQQRRQQQRSMLPSMSAAEIVVPKAYDKLAWEEVWRAVGHLNAANTFSHMVQNGVQANDATKRAIAILQRHVTTFLEGFQEAQHLVHRPSSHSSEAARGASANINLRLLLTNDDTLPSNDEEGLMAGFSIDYADPLFLSQAGAITADVASPVEDQPQAEGPGGAAELVATPPTAAIPDTDLENLIEEVFSSHCDEEDLLAQIARHIDTANSAAMVAPEHKSGDAALLPPLPASAPLIINPVPLAADEATDAELDQGLDLSADDIALLVSGATCGLVGSQGHWVDDEGAERWQRREKRSIAAVLLRGHHGSRVGGVDVPGNLRQTVFLIAAEHFPDKALEVCVRLVFDRRRHVCRCSASLGKEEWVSVVNAEPNHEALLMGTIGRTEARRRAHAPLPLPSCAAARLRIVAHIAGGGALTRCRPQSLAAARTRVAAPPIAAARLRIAAHAPAARLRVAARASGGGALTRCRSGLALSELNIQVNVTKCAALVPASGGARERAAAVFAAANVPVPVCDDGITLMGVPVGTEGFVRAQVAATLRAPGTDRLVAELVQMEDVQAAFSILRLAVPARAGHVSRNTAPSLTHEELRRFDAITLAAVAALAQEPSAGLTPPAHQGAPAAGDDCRGPPAVSAAAAPPSLWVAAVAWVRGADWGGEAPVTLPAHQQVRVHLRLGSGGFGVLGAAPRACAAFAARSLECMGLALAAFPVAARSRVLEHARYGFTFTQIATCLQQLRSGSDEAASALALLLPTVWYQDWRQDDGAWRALRDLLQRAGGAAGPGMRTRAGARRAAAPAVAREPGSAQAPPAAVLPRRQAALSRVLDAALAATQLRRLEAANALEAVAAWRSGASKGAMGFLAQLPSTDPAETMSPPEFRETLRRHLGVERPAPAAARCPKCHRPVDSGAHLRRCTQGLNVTRHNLLADALFQLLKQVAHLRGLDRGTLAPGPFRHYAARHGFNKFMDIVFGSNQAQGGARDVQRVLESASQEKIDTYVVSGALDPTTHTLFSAAFDHFGAMSRDTQALLHALAEQSSQGSYNLAQRVAFWRRRTSLALQRALTRVVIDNWNAVIAPDGGMLKQVAHLRGLDRDTLAPFRRYAARHGFNKFMDIVFGSNQICLPVPKVQPSADAAQGGARDVQRVLESASQEKIDTYVVSGALDPTTHTLFSAAFDHFGAMSRDTQALLHALAEQSSQGSYNLAQRVAFWRRRASLALQRALTRVVIDNWNAVIAPDGDVSAYRRIALLQVPRPSPASAEPPAPP